MNKWQVCKLELVRHVTYHRTSFHCPCVSCHYSYVGRVPLSLRPPLSAQLQPLLGSATIALWNCTVLSTFSSHLMSNTCIVPGLTMAYHIQVWCTYIRLHPIHCTFLYPAPSVQDAYVCMCVRTYVRMCKLIRCMCTITKWYWLTMLWPESPFSIRFSWLKGDICVRYVPLRYPSWRGLCMYVRM